MATKQLILDFRVNAREARQKLKELQGVGGAVETAEGGTGILGVVSSLKAIVKPYVALGAAVVGVGIIIKNELEKYTEYVTEVGNLASSLNLTVEEASFLTGAMEEYGITNITMIAVFRRMVKEGIEPTIEGLRDVLFEYDTLEGIDKSAFANEMFGPAGVKEILPWWESLTKLQKERVGYQESGLAVTKEMVTESQNLLTTTALVTTEWDTIKAGLIQGVMPTLITIGQYIYIMLDLSKRMKAYWANMFDTSGAAPAPGNTGLWGEPLPGFLDLFDPPGPGSGGRGGRAYGGDWTVGGTGGIDSERVSFMATPGETVSVGGGITDNQKILAEMRRLVDTLPIAIADAVGRV